MKKIILFTDSLGAGGAQRQLVGLAQLLQEKGYNIIVLTYHKDEFYLPFLQEHNVKYVLLGKVQGSFKRILAVIKYIKKEKPDTLIAYQETPSLIACCVKMILPKIKVIASERNTTQILDFRTKFRFFLYRWVDRIIPNSFSQERYIKTYNPKLGDKISTITNFVDLEKFSFSEHLKRDIPEIITPASLMTSKNALGYIDACALLKAKGFRFHVSWYGISPKWLEYYNQCIEKIKNYALEDYISIFEKTREIDKKYKEADFLCLPSFFEGTPNVICEAISTGLPVMCSNVCDNSIYVVEGVNGVLFDPQNVENIALKMEKLINISREDYNLYRVNSRRIAEEKLKEVTFVNKYIDILE